MPRRLIVWLLIGIGSAIAGLLPWIITGMRLPLQNLWGSDTLPAGMPVALLPFSQYYVGFLAGIMIVGSTIAGIVVRTRRGPLLPLIAGVLLVQVVALVQTVIVVSNGLSHRNASFIYLAVIVGGIVLAIVIGVIVLALVARAPRVGVLIGATLAAIVLPYWLRGLFHPVGTVSTYSLYSDMTNMAAQYLPAIALGVLIAWVGVGSVGRAVAGAGALLLLWIGSTIALVGTVVAGTRVMLGRPAEMLEYGGQVFQTAIVAEGGPLWAAWVAALAAFLGVIAWSVAQRRTATAAPAPAPTREPEPRPRFPSSPSSPHR